MKKILLSTVALLGLTMTAGAADLPRRTIAPAPIVAVPVFTWSGFYVGVNAGYGFGNNDEETNSYFLPFGSVVGTTPAGQTFAAATSGTLTINNRDNNDRDGFVGGAQIGYNFQFGSFVAGVEADLQFADLGGNNNDNRFFGTGGFYSFVPVGPGAVGLGAFGAPAPAVVTNNGNGGIDWFGTVRARLGFAFDRVLVYGTGGFAFGGGGDSNNGYNFGFYGDNDDDTRVGYALGGGIEYAFTNNLTFKLEGLYVNLGDSNNHNGGVAVFDLPTNTVFINDSKRDHEFGLVRVGINYKF
jgi:outer membrane immunogenic protein